MATFIDSLPPGLLTSSSGNGFAILGALAFGGTYFAFTKDAATAGIIGGAAAGAISLAFPQRAAKAGVPADPAATQAAVTELEAALTVVASKIAEGEKAKSAMAAIVAPKPTT